MYKLMTIPNTTPPVLAVGQQYPFNHQGMDGASMQLLKAGSILQVFYPGMSRLEEATVRWGEMEMGLIEDQPLLLFVIRIKLDNQEPLFLEASFDSRIVPSELLPFDDDSTLNPEARLLFTVHLVDSASGELKGLRMITMPQPVTQHLYRAVRQQATLAGSMEPRMARYQQMPLEQMPSMTTLYPCGE